MRVQKPGGRGGPRLDSRDKAGGPLGILSCGRQGVPTGLWWGPWALLLQEHGKLGGKEELCRKGTGLS